MIIEKNYYPSILLSILFVPVLWATKLYSYLLFHSLAELFSVVVAGGIFIMAWDTRKSAKSGYLLFLGIAYLFIGFLDLVHTLAYKGMGIFQGYNTNLPTQLWISARYVESISLLFAPLLIRRRLKTNSVFLGYIIATSILLGSIFYWNVFPACFIEGAGLTTFKKVSEYIISLLLLASIAALFNERNEFEQDILRLLIASIIVTMASEIAFTLYSDAYGLANFIGHILKIVSFYLLYKAIVETLLTRPFALLFRNLKRSEDALRGAKENLEHQVNVRTAELTQANEALKGEITQRKQTEMELQMYQKRLKALASQLTLAEERERRRIAADLHDHVGQSLALARMQIASVHKLASDPRQTAILDEISNSLRQTVQETRDLIYDLSPPQLNEIVSEPGKGCKAILTVPLDSGLE